MKKSLGWTRREFMQRAAGASAAAAMTRLPLQAAGRATADTAPRFAYVGCGDAATEQIAVFAIGRESWRQVQTVAAARPAALVLSPDQRFLYAVNEIDRYQHLPSGSVETYAIDSRNGSLALLNRQPLSLSATNPRHAAVSPDGRSLVVAVHGGGAYNVLPIGHDGQLGRVIGILKETGFGPDEEHQQAAHPQRVIFDRQGRLLSADMGSDRLNVFALEVGQLRVMGRSEARAGSGPRQIEFHPSGSLLFVANALEPSVSSYRYDHSSGQILERLQRMPVDRSGRGGKAAVAMAMHPSGKFLYTSLDSQDSGMTAWRVDPQNGSLTAIGYEKGIVGSLHSLTVLSDGNALLALSRDTGKVMRWRIDADGQLSERTQMAKIPAPISMAVRYL